jgi:hypothetical protein
MLSRYEMSNAAYVNIYSSGIINVTSDPFIKVASDFKSVCRQQPLCVSDGC